MKPFSYLLWFGLILLLRALYRKFEYVITLRKLDAIVWGLFFLVLLFTHGPFLFLSLGGDELFHAEWASFLILKFSELVKRLPALSRPEYLESIWRLFDIRHLPVPDLWRLISFPLVLAGAFSVLSWRSIKNLSEFSKCLILLGLCLCAGGWGYYFALPVSLHPPFRLFPLFMGKLLFGYNPVAFRMPGLVVVATVCLVLYRLLKEDSLWSFLIALASAFLPVVFYVTDAVEPSVYGYGTWVTILLLGGLFLESKDSRLLVVAGTLLGVSTLTRQTTLVLWVWIGFLFLLSNERKRLLFGLRVFLPSLVALPYFLYARSHFIYHTNEGPWYERLIRSLQTGVGPMAILNSTTLPWLIFIGLVGMSLLFFRKLKSRNLSPFLMFIPAYAVFHTIMSYLWGLGRYQAEYIAPFLVLVLFYLGRSVQLFKLRVFASFLLIYLSTYTIEMIYHLSRDINYKDWPQMRISSTANLPYTEALEDLHRREVGGGFVLVGGQPWYGDAVLWLSGHSFSETQTWRRNQEAADALMAKTADVKEWLGFLRDRKIHYLVVQDGTKREFQHEPPHVRNVKKMIEEQATRRSETSGISLFKQWGPEQGGSLNVYHLAGGF